MEEDFESWLPFYALGSLSAEERRRLEAALERDAGLRKALQDWVETAQALPLAAAPMEPDPQVKERLLQRVRGQAAPRRASRGPEAPARRGAVTRAGRFRVPAWGALGLLLSAVSLALVVLTRRELAEVRAQNVALGQEILRQQQVLVAISDPRYVPITLAGTEVQPGARGRLFADPQGRSGILLVSGLTPLGPEQVYQVWLIQGEAPTSAGLLNVSASGDGAVVLQAANPIGSYTALGVSLEPPGGSPLPSGPIVLLHELTY